MQKDKRNKKIGVFDSGFGGLDVLKGILKENSEYDYIYLGDSARTPYGSRSQEVIYEFTKQAIDFLCSKGCELIIIACNTASAEALRKIQKIYLPKKYPNKKVLGVLIPAVEDALEKHTRGKIGVLATESTVRSLAFVHEIHKRNKNIKVIQQACPLLVPIVEEGLIHKEATSLILKKYLRPFIKKVDTLILGCTHYGILESSIKKIVGKDVYIVSENKVVPKKLSSYLKKHNEVECVLQKTGTRQFFSTDTTKGSQRLVVSFLVKKLKVEK